MAGSWLRPGAPPRGSPLALRLNPERARADAGFDYSAIGLPDQETIEQLAARLTALSAEHAGAHGTGIGWILSHLHDPDGHEIRPYPHQQHAKLDPRCGSLPSTTRMKAPDGASRLRTCPAKERDGMMSPTDPPPASLDQNPAAADDPKALCARSLYIVPRGDLREFEALIHPEATSREAAHEPMASRGKGPAAFYATALWLRGAFSDLHWDIYKVVADGDLVAVYSTMSGRHTGLFAHYDGAGEVSKVMPPTGRAFSATQTHWFRHADGKVIEHWANRDDLTMAQQAGWIPPGPRYRVRMALAKRRARNAASA